MAIIKKGSSKTKRTDGLRKRAEKKISKPMKNVRDMSDVEIKKLIHELQVHQIELEMQNEASQKSQMEAAESHRKYTDLYDFSPIGYLILNKKGHIIETNVTGASLLGFEKRSLTGQPFHRFINPGNLNIFQSHLQKAVEIKSKQACKLKLTRKDGSLFYALIETIAVIDSKGKLDHYRSSLTDITEIVRAEEALTQEKLFSEAVTDSLPGLFFVLDEKGQLARWNKNTEEISGYSAEELSSLKALTAIAEEDRDFMIRKMEEVFVKGAATAEVYIIMKSGNKIPYYLTGRRIVIRDKPYLLGIGIDITERKQAETALRKRTSQLEKSNKELESFSYSVSHDLRAPMRAIDGYARMILRKQGDKFDEDTLRKFNDIRLNARKMGQLIDDLLAVSRLGRKSMSISELNMVDLIRDVWKELYNINPERKMNLIVDSTPIGCGDRTLVKQVYFNLLSNAVKFTKVRDEARIEVGGNVDGNENLYYVKDNGIGFDMAYHDKLFGVFQRLHSGDDFEGTGIGLATVQSIIQRHGGRVWAEGRVNEGATFYFSLPSLSKNNPSQLDPSTGSG